MTGTNRRSRPRGFERDYFPRPVESWDEGGFCLLVNASILAIPVQSTLSILRREFAGIHFLVGTLPVAISLPFAFRIWVGCGVRRSSLWEPQPQCRLFLQGDDWRS